MSLLWCQSVSFIDLEFTKESIMIPEERKNQARLSLLDLENAVLRVLAKRQSMGSLNLKTKYIQ